MPEISDVETIYCEKCGKPVFFAFVWFTPILNKVDIFCSQSCKEQYEKIIEALGTLFY